MFRDDTKLHSSFKIKMGRSGDQYTLTISGTTTKQSGLYRCVATNKLGKAEHSAQVTINEKMEPPKFTTKLSNKDVKEGQKCTMTCQVKGKPLPELTWFKGDAPLEFTENVHVDTKEVRGELQASLTVDVSTETDAGQLKVIAKNPAGEATTSAKLNVKSKHK